MKKILIIILFSFCLLDAGAQNMEWLCRPGRYTDIQYMGYDLFKVKDSEGKWGIMSSEGQEILKAEHDSITAFVEMRSLILDKSGNRILNILDNKGEIIKSFQNDHIFVTRYPYFKEGLLVFVDNSGKYGYLDDKGEVRIVPQFLFAAPFQSNVATVQYIDDGVFGIINKYGASAIIDNTQYRLLSSPVNGYVFASVKTRLGVEALRLMRLDGNKLKGVKTIENHIEWSEECIIGKSTNHQYSMDNQWRVSGADYDYTLPYVIDDKPLFAMQSNELLSKHEVHNGVQITYKGKPILENFFDDVRTYEKYAIVRGDDNSRSYTGVLRLNPSAGIELVSPTEVLVFYHNPLPFASMANNADFSIDMEYYAEVHVDIKDVDASLLKCYLNEDGNLTRAPLKENDGGWLLYIPYFHPEIEFGKVSSRDLDIAVTYDGLDWMHREITLSSMHEKGFEVSISGKDSTDENGEGVLYINVESVNGTTKSEVRISVKGLEPIYMKDGKARVPIHITVPEGETREFSYAVTVFEEGCPTIKETVSKKVTCPEKEEPEMDLELM